MVVSVMLTWYAIWQDSKGLFIGEIQGSNEAGISCSTGLEKCIISE